MSIKEVGRRLTSPEDSFDALMQRLKDYIDKLGGILITVTRNNTDKTKTNRRTITRKQRWKEKYPIDVLSDK